MYCCCKRTYLRAPNLGEVTKVTYFEVPYVSVISITTVAKAGWVVSFGGPVFVEAERGKREKDRDRETCKKNCEPGALFLGKTAGQQAAVLLEGSSVGCLGTLSP